jgi:hypothetical protein
MFVDFAFFDLCSQIWLSWKWKKILFIPSLHDTVFLANYGEVIFDSRAVVIPLFENKIKIQTF